MDWDKFARRVERAVDMRGDGGFRDLFAPGARFADPANDPTEDLRDIQRQTRDVFPDWRQEVTSIRGGEDWAVFEWIGHATYKGIPITMHGATIVEVDADGLVTSWRDYLDRKEPEEQIRRGVRGSDLDRLAAPPGAQHQVVALQGARGRRRRSPWWCRPCRSWPAAASPVRARRAGRAPWTSDGRRGAGRCRTRRSRSVRRPACVTARPVPPVAGLPSEIVST